MAHVLSNTASHASFFGFFANGVKSITTSIAQYKVYRTTKNELSSLTDYNLADLGLSRSMIERISLEAAYGPLK